MNDKDFVSSLREIFDMDKELKSMITTNESFIELFISHTELLKLILDVTKLPDSKALRVTDPFRVEIYDDDGDYCHTIDCNPHYDLNQKIKKELKLDDYYL